MQGGVEGVKGRENYCFWTEFSNTLQICKIFTSQHYYVTIVINTTFV